MPAPEEIRSCKKHGETQFAFEGPHGWRCKKCRRDHVISWRRRVKEKLVKEAGGRCLICGYNRHLGSLQFHHLDPTQKSFGLAQGGCTRSYEKCLEESKKCALLCGNCHREVEDGVTVIPVVKAPGV